MQSRAAIARVSVVIPLYNKSNTINRAIQSVFAQTYTDFDLIIVDDGSTDGSGTWVYNSTNPRVRYIRQKNLGPGAARNRGVLETSSELIAFLDADDEWYPSFLEESIAILDASANKTVAAIFSGYVEGPNRTVTESRWRAAGLKAGINYFGRASPAPYVITLLNYMNVWACVMRRSAFEHNGGFYAKNNCVYAEDSYLWLRLLMHDKVFVNFEPLVWWHNEDSDLSKNLKGVRPIEPFLTDSLGLRVSTPTHMLTLLEEVLALRAAKTAAVLSFWGQWQTARHLLQIYPSRRNGWQKIVIAAKLAANPLGAWAGSLMRFVLAARGSSRLGATTFSK